MNDANAANDLAGDAGNSAATEDATVRLEKDIAAVKTEIAHLSQQIADAVNALGVIAQNETRRGLGRARANVGAFTADASERAGAAAD